MVITNEKEGIGPQWQKYYLRAHFFYNKGYYEAERNTT
jgi:hypothetical protein